MSRDSPWAVRAVALVPTAALSTTAAALALREQGSILSQDWLPYAAAAALLGATILASGWALQPSPAAGVGLVSLVALGIWTGLSASWSPVPALARDEALLFLFYAIALAIPLLTLRSEGYRVVAIAIVVAASVALVVATCMRLVTGDDLADFYWSKRLASPIGYPGADAALFLVSFWPAAALAASRRLNLFVRVPAFAGSVALLAGWLMTQSRAASVALAVSAVLVFALAPSRLRLLVPVGLAGALAALSYRPLTEPFRAEESAFEHTIHDAGEWTLALFLISQVVGLAYALADQRFHVGPSLARAAGLVATGAVVLAATVGLGTFLVAVDRPGDYLQERWEDFKRQPERETGSSHLTTVGTNRYDLWRVALNQFRQHPVAGEGARSFGTRYVRDGRTRETPQRSHSLELDVLGETGFVGLALFTAALTPFGWAVLRRAREDLVAAGLLGAVVYWLVQASGDWIWTFPAVALPFFVLLGTGAADETRGIAARAALPAGVALAVAALALFTPPWLSSRYTAAALEQSAAEAVDDLRWARRLDPLSIEPLIAEAELAASPQQAVRPLEKAVEREPRSVGPRYLLGLTYLAAERVREARRELRKAVELAPRSPSVRDALRRAEEARERHLSRVDF